VHGDFTRPDDDAPAGQRGQRPSFVGACSARIFVAEPCSAMNRTRVCGRSGALTASSSWAVDDLDRSSVTAASGSPERHVLAEGHSIDPRCQLSISTSAADPSYCLDRRASQTARPPCTVAHHASTVIHYENG
jgi:hypothetical protein